MFEEEEETGRACRQRGFYSTVHTATDVRQAHQRQRRLSFISIKSIMCDSLHCLKLLPVSEGKTCWKKGAIEGGGGRGEGGEGRERW